MTFWLSSLLENTSLLFILLLVKNTRGWKLPGTEDMEGEKKGWFSPAPKAIRCWYVLSHLSRIWLFATLWIVAHHAPLFTGFSKQEYWSGLLCLPPGALSDPGMELESLISPALAGRFFTTSANWEAQGSSHQERKIRVPWLRFEPKLLRPQSGPLYNHGVPRSLLLSPFLLSSTCKKRWVLLFFFLINP